MDFVEFEYSTHELGISFVNVSINAVNTITECCVGFWFELGK
jgi:hypothetical protein